MGAGYGRMLHARVSDVLSGLTNGFHASDPSLRDGFDTGETRRRIALVCVEHLSRCVAVELDGTSGLKVTPPQDLTPTPMETPSQIWSAYDKITRLMAANGAARRPGQWAASGESLTLATLATWLVELALKNEPDGGNDLVAHMKERAMVAANERWNAAIRAAAGDDIATSLKDMDAHTLCLLKDAAEFVENYEVGKKQWRT